MTSNIEPLAQSWIEAKETEKNAVEVRRDIEDQLIKILSIKEDQEGTDSYEVGEYSVKIVGRLNRKVDADKIQDLAAENGLVEHLQSLFRWKPEINMAIWKASDERITRPLAGAITAKPGRPSFTIDIIKE